MNTCQGTFRACSSRSSLLAGLVATPVLPLDTGQQVPVATLVRHENRLFAGVWRLVCNGKGIGGAAPGADGQQGPPIHETCDGRFARCHRLAIRDEREAEYALTLMSVWVFSKPVKATNVIRSSAACFVIVSLFFLLLQRVLCRRLWSSC